jgi:hypothetical protein
MMMKHNPYDGATRKEYLDGLARDFEVSRKTVYLLADLLGPSEDFDGLITELEEISESEGFEE